MVDLRVFNLMSGTLVLFVSIRVHVNKPGSGPVYDLLALHAITFRAMAIVKRVVS